MNLMDYGSDDDSCVVEEVDLEECERVQETDLPPVNDLEFIQSMAADFNYEYSADTEASKVVNMKDERESEFNASSDSESETEAMADGGGTAEALEESSSSSSDSSSDSEDENIATKKGYKKAARLISMYTEEEGDDVPSGPLKTKNEVDEVVEPINPDLLTIEDTSALICIGEVKYRIDHECVVVIQADFTTSPLNEGSVLCNVDGKVLGKIQEIFGPITTPYYTVRWKNNAASAVGNNSKPAANAGGKNSKKNKGGKRGKAGGSAVTSTAPVAEDPATASTPTTTTAAVHDSAAAQPSAEAMMQVEKGDTATPSEQAAQGSDTAVPIDPSTSTAVGSSSSALQIADVRALFPVGANLFSAPAHCTYVLPGQMKQLRSKGSDASNAYDEEPPEDEVEFSDDEQEMLAKQARKQKLKSAKGGAAVDITVGDAIPCGRGGGWRPERYSSGRGGGRGGGRGAGRGGGGYGGVNNNLPMYGGLPMMQQQGMGGAYGQQLAMGYPSLQMPMQQLPMGYHMQPAAGFPQQAGFQGYAPQQQPLARPPPPSYMPAATTPAVPYMATPQQPAAAYMPATAASGSSFPFQQQQFMHAQQQMQGGPAAAAGAYQQGYAMMGGAGTHHLHQQQQGSGPPQYTYQPLPFTQQQQQQPPPKR